MLPISLVSPRLVLQGMWRFQQIGILLGCSWYLWWALLDFYASMVVRMWVGIRKNKNMSSCGSCWWLCTVQLVCWLMELLGPWSEIHDNIWTCLVEVPHWGYGPLEADRSRQIVLAEVRECGRIAETIPGLCKILSGHV